MSPYAGATLSKLKTLVLLKEMRKAAYHLLGGITSLGRKVGLLAGRELLGR
jgi:hypothetical protein